MSEGAASCQGGVTLGKIMNSKNRLVPDPSYIFIYFIHGLKVQIFIFFTFKPHPIQLP